MDFRDGGSKLRVGSYGGSLGWLLVYILISIVPIDPTLDFDVLRRRLAEFREWESGTSAARAPLIGNAIVIALVIWVESSTSLVNWNCAFPLAIGNELSGDRPWVGRIDPIHWHSTRGRSSSPRPRVRLAGSAILFTQVDAPSLTVLSAAIAGPAIGALLVRRWPVRKPTSIR